MQGADNLIWFLAEVAIFLLSVAAVWFLVLTGRDRPAANQKHGETVEKFADGLEEGHAPLSKFLIGTYIFVGVWAVAYLLWTGFHGLQ